MRTGYKFSSSRSHLGDVVCVLVMAIYVDEVWKCPKHPSDGYHHREGVCPECLKERLFLLCPDCSNVRTCSCSAAVSDRTTTIKGSSSSRFYGYSCGGGGGEFDRDITPAFQKSRSTGNTYGLARKGVGNNKDDGVSVGAGYRKKITRFWSKFKSKFTRINN